MPKYMDKHEPGAVPHRYRMIKNGKLEIVDGGVVEEALVTIYINGQELATLMCSPLDQEALALGFLFNEGVIQSSYEVELVKANVARTVVDVFLSRPDFDPPRRLIITSGCGGGITLQHLTESYPALNTEFTTTPEIIFRRMRDLMGAARLFNLVRGIHTAILADAEQMLINAEDVGRHNTIDKIAGKALQAGIDMRGRILLTSGRISSEMLGKARRMEIPVVASHTSPTSITVRLAQAWNICVVGYVRGRNMRVYTHPHRLGLPEI